MRLSRLTTFSTSASGGGVGCGAGYGAGLLTGSSIPEGVLRENRAGVGAVSVRVAAGGATLTVSAAMVSFAGMHSLIITLALHVSFFGNILNNVETAFRHYGYLIIFFPILGESAAIPLPGETVLLAGGLAAARGILSLPLVILVGASAAILGDNLGYLVGRRGGRPLLLRYGQILHVKDRQIAILDSFFARHGPKTVFFGRWVIF